jgi:hypothetical protein
MKKVEKEKMKNIYYKKNYLLLFDKKIEIEILNKNYYYIILLNIC